MDDDAGPLLLGYAALRVEHGRTVYRFGPGHPARLRVVRGIGSFTLSLCLADTAVALDVRSEARDDVAFVHLTVPASTVSGRGMLSLDGCPQAHHWSVEWVADPEADAMLGGVRALRKAGHCDDADAAVSAIERGSVDPAIRFWCAFERGRILRARGLQDEASRVWERSATLARRAGVDSWASRTLRAAAYLAYLQRDFDRAVDLLERVEQVERETGDIEGRINSEFYRGMIANERGALVEARRHYDRALTLGRRCGSSAVAFFETALGLLHLNLGEFDAAQAIARRLLTRLADGPDDVHHQAGERFTAAWMLLQCGLRTGDLDVPLIERLLDDGLALARDAREPQLELMGLFNRAWLSWWTGDVAATRRDLAAVAERQRAFAEQHPQESMLLAREYDLLSGQLQIAAGELDPAAATLRQLLAATELESAGQPTLLALGARLGLAHIAQRRGRLQDAADALDAGMAIITELALDVDRKRAVTLLRDRPLLCDPVAVIDARIDLSEARGDRDTAFGTADTLHALRRRQIDQRAVLKTLDASTRDAWQRLGGRIDELRERYDRIRADWRLTDAERSARLLAASATLRGLFERRLRLLERPGASYSPPTLTQIRAQLAPDDALLMLRMRSRGGLEAWWVTHDRGERALPEALEPWLDARLPGVGHLYIVGDLRSGAWKLPRMRIGDDVLAARVGISFPGHAGALRRRPSNRGRGALIVADPLSDLPLARRDGRAFAEDLTDARALIGAEATRRAVVDGLGDCDLFHFSGHGELHDDDVELRLADGASLRPEDIIGAARIPDRVVLNGCRTAVGFADHAVSLAGAFLTAGAKSVLGTTRPVSDRRASGFVGRFYHCGGADDPAGALRAATRWAIERGDDIWSAYRLMGAR